MPLELGSKQKETLYHHEETTQSCATNGQYSHATVEDMCHGHKGILSEPKCEQQ